MTERQGQCAENVICVFTKNTLYLQCNQKENGLGAGTCPEALARTVGTPWQHCE
jgi:hypothetical protein